VSAPSANDISAYLAQVDSLRSEASPVFGTLLGPIFLGPGAGAITAVAGIYWDFIQRTRRLSHQAQRPQSPQVFLSCLGTSLRRRMEARGLARREFG
jgi:hypothetical protein